MKYGSDRLIEDLQNLGFTVEKVTAKGGEAFAVISDYEIKLGKFASRIIGLGIQSTADFPRTVASAIHVRADPQLYETTDTVPNVRNVTTSVLGPDWRYWSKNFGWTEERSARRLVSQINTIFENA